MQEKVHEDLIKITKYEVLGKLPNPFIMEDGGIADTKEKWAKQRKYLYKSAIELQYGTQPPEPEFLEVDRLYKNCSFKITTGKRDNPISFYMRVFVPNGNGPFTAVIDGDMCFPYMLNPEYYTKFTSQGIMLVLFDRCELAHDISSEGRGHGRLYEVYPEYTFGALGAWAWGYSRCVDALEKLGIADMNLITFTGHSRGGKTVALAGALDERAAIVNPNATCAGACSCYRIHMSAIKENGNEYRNETLADLLTGFPHWMGEGMQEYKYREQDLPFDCHYLKALVAPRTLFVSEAASDMWSGPVGAWMTTMAAAEVYKFLGVEENLLWYFRRGEHFHHLDDIDMLVNIILHKRDGVPLNDYYFITPFKQPELIFDWRAPKIAE